MRQKKRVLRTVKALGAQQVKAFAAKLLQLVKLVKGFRTQENILLVLFSCENVISVE